MGEWNKFRSKLFGRVSRTIGIEYFLCSLLGGFRPDLSEICHGSAVLRQDSMREDEPPEEESEAMKSIRSWRQTERKKMVESIERLLEQARKLATSQYT